MSKPIEPNYNKGINVLSLFDGISCGQIALHRAGIKVNQYFASEIGKHAIKVTQHNWPDAIQLGSVVDVNVKNLPKIDLIIAGSPCQGFSFAGKQLNFLDPRSKLFFEFVRLLNELKVKNPDIKFLLENVKMKKEFQKIISDNLNTTPIEIDSSLVSAQKRKRLYWTNIEGNILPLIDKKITIKDIIETSGDFEFVHQDIYQNGEKRGISWQYDGTNKGYNSQNYRAYFLDGKMGCLSHSAPHGAKILTKNGVRKTTRIEHERLQTIPDNYTSPIQINKAKAALGNGWTVDVIAHIFSFLPQEFKNG